MDAHDEFFGRWCEPEAWCERCEEHPAIHMIVQNDDTPLEPCITYVRVWDADQQAHVALCLRCNKANCQVPGSQNLQYVPSPRTASPQQQRLRQYREHPIWPYLRRWGAGLLAFCTVVWACRKLMQHSTNTKPYSRTGI
jgi:hypothetical protein